MIVWVQASVFGGRSTVNEAADPQAAAMSARLVRDRPARRSSYRSQNAAVGVAAAEVHCQRFFELVIG